MITYTLNSDGTISGNIHDLYTFNPNTPAELHSPNLDVPFPLLDSFSSDCGWKWGKENVTDLWMYDLELHGFGKSFYTTIEWKL